MQPDDHLVSTNSLQHRHDPDSVSRPWNSPNVLDDLGFPHNFISSGAIANQARAALGRAAAGMLNLTLGECAETSAR